MELALGAYLFAALNLIKSIALVRKFRETVYIYDV